MPSRNQSKITNINLYLKNIGIRSDILTSRSIWDQSRRKFNTKCEDDATEFAMIFSSATGIEKFYWYIANTRIIKFTLLYIIKLILSGVLQKYAYCTLYTIAH